jgi:DNA polymerase-3 subunit delta
MILKGGEATRYLARPDPARAGLLIAGADPMRVALKRQEAVAALIGPGGEAEMRLARLAASDLRKDPAALSDAMRATGFFPGPRVVLVDEATDGLADTIGAALADWRAGDAVVVVTAGALTAKSTLKGLFDRAKNAVSVMLYDDPPGREEIEEALRKAGLTQLAPEALAELMSLARALEPGDFRQTLEKVALYKHGDATPLTPAEVATLAPATVEAEVDELIAAVAERRVAALGPLVRRLEGQGVLPVTICIAMLRHVRLLHGVLADPAGVASALGRARVNFRLRDAMERQARTWDLPSVEQALALLVETDLTLRSSSRAPGMAVMERTLIRLAMLRR